MPAYGNRYRLLALAHPAGCQHPQDVTIAVRMDAANEGIRDYYVLPGLDMTWENLRVAEANGIGLDTYRFDTLDCFFGMAERVKLEELA